MTSLSTKGKAESNRKSKLLTCTTEVLLSTSIIPDNNEQIPMCGSISLPVYLHEHACARTLLRLCTFYLEYLENANARSVREYCNCAECTLLNSLGPTGSTKPIIQIGLKFDAAFTCWFRSPWSGMLLSAHKDKFRGINTTLA